VERMGFLAIVTMALIPPGSRISVASSHTDSSPRTSGAPLTLVAHRPISKRRLLRRRSWAGLENIAPPGRSRFPVITFSASTSHEANVPNSAVWVPIRPGVSLRPMMFDITNGGWSNLLRIGAGERLACHYHTQPVHGFTLKGSWRYLEHNWVASEGTYIFEPPGEMHSPELGVDHDFDAIQRVTGKRVVPDVACVGHAFPVVPILVAVVVDHERARGRDQTSLVLETELTLRERLELTFDLVESPCDHPREAALLHGDQIRVVLQRQLPELPLFLEIAEAYVRRGSGYLLALGHPIDSK